uniref:PPM-type phosphatase domain-containing protein n=1 Tax=Steinernema glaseri TaxID=37863 RepID=A0A1I8A5B2_9BILA
MQAPKALRNSIARIWRYNYSFESSTRRQPVFGLVMPSSFIRKRVYGLIRTTFTPSQSSEDDTLGSGIEDVVGGRVAEHPTRVVDPNSTPSSDNSFISQCITAGRHGRQPLPEIYAGKTGLDLPVIHLQKLRVDVKATDTGPEGGLTQVEEMRRSPIVNMANLDDELNLSMDGELPSDDDEEDERVATLKVSRNKMLGSCSSIIGPNCQNHNFAGASKKNYSWEVRDEERATGLSVSLYEKNPVTGICAGTPIADVYGVIARENNGVLALADGVNWGEGARLAARCAVRGALDHLNQHIEDGLLHTTTDVFHCLLGAFHAGHALILQEGGLLTTLCVAVALPVKNSDAWVLCVCNVGDSLCFVFNESYGVREVTLASHDIGQMRDMRDAGGALGPVDGRNPQLQNLTCSMTFIEQGDLVFITSDGVSDNFDPVVGKFCVIKRTDTDKENTTTTSGDKKAVSVTVKDNGRDEEFARTRRCKATLPCVDALQRHELMLLRMNDIVLNGFQTAERDDATPQKKTITAGSLCHNLVQFAHQLSMAKRRTLEDPELYKNEKLSKSEERARRKMVRGKISEMPGKLDHASVVAYRVGWWDGQPDDLEYDEVKILK